MYMYVCIYIYTYIFHSLQMLVVFFKKSNFSNMQATYLKILLTRIFTILCYLNYGCLVVL